MTTQASGAAPLSQSRVDAKHHYRFKYLKSEHWGNLRIAKLASVDAKCKRCEKRDLHNDVHHLRYKKLYDVELIDLVVLCRECHTLVHEALDGFRDYIKKSEDVWLRTMEAAQWIAAEKHYGEKVQVKEGADIFRTYSRFLRNKRQGDTAQRRYLKSLESGKRSKVPPWLQPEVGKMWSGLRKEGILNPMIIILDPEGHVFYTRDMI